MLWWSWWTVALAASLDLDIARVPDGGSNDWDIAVRGLLLKAYDEDRSGMLEGRDELVAIPCPVWRALDVGVREGWPAGLVTTYGFAEGTWIGGVLGFDDGARRPSLAAMERCGVPVGVGTTSTAALRTQAQPPPRDTPNPVDGVRDARSVAGSAAWDHEVADQLILHFDGDRSGAISSDELRLVPCGVWLAMDLELRRAGFSGVSERYALDGAEPWSGGKLRLARELRPQLSTAISACGVGVTERTAVDVTLFINRLDAIPDGGSDPWDAEVKKLMVEAYDRDRSGKVDSAEEVDALGCDAWLAVDRGVRAGWGNGMYTIYGFGPGLRWVGDALGLGESVRGRAASALAACGVAPTRFTDAGDAVEAAVAKVPAPGAGAWDDEVRSLLLIAYDADGSGAVDTLAEVSGIGCGVFVRLDGQLRTAFPKGFAATYGVSGGEWLGESLGFGLATRTALNARVGVCLGSTR